MTWQAASARHPVSPLPQACHPAWATTTCDRAPWSRLVTHAKRSAPRNRYVHRRSPQSPFPSTPVFGRNAQIAAGSILRRTRILWISSLGWTQTLASNDVLLLRSLRVDGESSAPNITVAARDGARLSHLGKRRATSLRSYRCSRSKVPRRTSFRWPTPRLTPNPYFRSR